MYTEEPRKRIDWPYLLRKIIIIVLIVLILFLIIWLINKGIKSNKVKNNYDTNSTIKENINNNNNNDNSGLSNPEYYSESFITNYMYFHDNARDFVEKNNLPIENNSVTYTLQELINKGIILPTSYGNSSCDTENSYVVVTNNNGKYTMTTTLICGKEIAKTTEELKCSGLCTNCGVIVEDECKDKGRGRETVEGPQGHAALGQEQHTHGIRLRCLSGAQAQGTGVPDTRGRGEHGTVAHRHLHDKPRRKHLRTDIRQHTREVLQRVTVWLIKIIYVTLQFEKKEEHESN